VDRAAGVEAFTIRQRLTAELSVHIADTYSHLNGEEFLEVRVPALLQEIKSVISAVEAEPCRVKKSEEKTMRGKRLYSPKALNKAFASHFKANGGWKSTTYRYCVTTEAQTLEEIVNLPLAAQRRFLEDHGNSSPIQSFKQVDFVKERVAVEIQFGKYAFVAYDLFIKHMLFYSGRVIDVGVEVLPTKAMLTDPAGGRRMSTGIAYFEGEVYNLLRHGRSNPPVPLLIIGVEP
jgi:hypothetical protein